MISTLTDKAPEPGDTGDDSPDFFWLLVAVIIAAFAATLGGC